MDYRSTDRILNYLPMFHGYSFCLMFMAMTTTSTIYIMRKFDMDIVLQSIEKYRITHLALVPPVLVHLEKYPGLSKFDFSSIKEIVCGAAALPKDVSSSVTMVLF